MNSDQYPQAAHTEYLDTFSLHFPPFENQIDSRFFYGGTALMQRLDLLIHLTQFGDSLILVTGPDGSGKSTLLGRFLDQANSQWRLCLLDGDEIEQLPDRLSTVLEGAPAANEQELLSQWATQTDSSQLLVLLVDNAEQLDDDACIRLCSLLSQPQGERIRIILFGGTETQACVKQALAQQTSSRTIQALEVPRLSEEETASYLMYRLAVAGYSGESPFTATEVRAICKAADGRPAGINRLAHEALLEHHARYQSKPLRSAAKVRRINHLAWGFAAVGVAAVAAFVGWQRLSPPAGETQGTSIAYRTTEERPLILPAAAPRREAPVTPKTPAQQSSAELETAPAEAAPEIPEAATATVTETALIEAPLKIPEAATGTEAATETAAIEPSPGVAATPAELPAAEQQDLPALAAAGGTPAADAAQTLPLSHAADAPETRTPAAETQPQPAREGTAAVEQAEQTKTAVHREDWLLQQPDDAFSLQLLGSRVEKSVTDFIAQHKLDPEQVAYYRGSHQGAEWYVLLYGVYPTRQAAIDGRAELPEKVRSNKPWPRSFKDVHTAIRDAK